MIDPKLIEEQKALIKQLADADEARMLAGEAVKAARKALDTFVKLHNDPITRQAGEDRKREFANRIIPPMTPEDEEWLVAVKARNAATMQRMCGVWWDKLENGVPIPFATIFKRVDPDRIGPLNKLEILPNATWGTVLVRLGVFSSLSEARKANKDGPLKPGENRIKIGNSIKRIMME